jgi:hypothetical protein
MVVSVQSQIARRDLRQKVFFPAAITSAELGTRRIHVLDLSSGGARLHVDFPLGIGESLIIEVLGEKHCAKVAWLNRKQVGVVFTFALPPAKLEAINAAHAVNRATTRDVI